MPLEAASACHACRIICSNKVSPQAAGLRLVHAAIDHSRPRLKVTRSIILKSMRESSQKRREVQLPLCLSDSVYADRIL